MAVSPTVWIWGLALISVSLSAAGQMLLKIGMTAPVARQALAQGLTPQALGVLGSPPLLGGLTCYGVGMLLWLVCLSKLPLTSAYPLVSLAIVLVLGLSVLFLGETLSSAKIVGSVLVVLGVVIIGRG